MNHFALIQPTGEVVCHGIEDRLSCAKMYWQAKDMAVIRERIRVRRLERRSNANAY